MLLRRVRRRLNRRPAPAPVAAPPEAPPYVPPAPPGPGRSAGGDAAVGVRRDGAGHVVVRMPDGAERATWIAAWADLPPGLADQLAACRATRWASEAGAGRAEGTDAVARAVSAALGRRP
jgi:hypothetical protein